MLCVMDTFLLFFFHFAVCTDIVCWRQPPEYTFSRDKTLVDTGEETDAALTAVDVLSVDSSSSQTCRTRKAAQPVGRRRLRCVRCAA